MKRHAADDLEARASGVEIDDDVGPRQNLVGDEAGDALRDGAASVAGKDPVHVLPIERRVATGRAKGRDIQHRDDDQAS